MREFLVTDEDHEAVRDVSRAAVFGSVEDLNDSLESPSLYVPIGYGSAVHLLATWHLIAGTRRFGEDIALNDPNLTDHVLDTADELRGGGIQVEDDQTRDFIANFLDAKGRGPLRRDVEPPQPLEVRTLAVSLALIIRPETLTLDALRRQQWILERRIATGQGLTKQQFSALLRFQRSTAP